MVESLNQGYAYLSMGPSLTFSQVLLALRNLIRPLDDYLGSFFVVMILYSSEYLMNEVRIFRFLFCVTPPILHASNSLERDPLGALGGDRCCEDWSCLAQRL